MYNTFTWFKRYECISVKSLSHLCSQLPSALPNIASFLHVFPEITLKLYKAIYVCAYMYTQYHHILTQMIA